MDADGAQEHEKRGPVEKKPKEIADEKNTGEAKPTANGVASGDATEKAASKLADDDAIEAAVRAGNINIQREDLTEIMDLTEESKEAQEQHAKLLKKVEAERRARTMLVPTKTEDVAARLRELGEPVRFFGENVADIRERLRRFLAAREMEDEESEKVQSMVAPKPAMVPRRMQFGADQSSSATSAKEGEDGAWGVVPAGGLGAGTAGAARKSEAVYTPASDPLLEARAAIAKFSFARARSRLAGAKRRRETPEEMEEVNRAAGNIYNKMRQLAISSSQFGDDRPLSAIQVSPDGGTVASGGWTCVLKLWDIENLEMRKVLRGHDERVTGVSWHPQAYSSAKPLLASGAADKTARVWDCESGECVRTLRGHAGRLARVGFHPWGRYLGTASFDYTWRLWDVETGEELLLQDGHHKEVYGITFQHDGALVATGDLNGVARTWDLRSGKSIWTMEGHVKCITCMDFSPCGYEVASGSDDHTVRVWDIRSQRLAYCLPAHSSLVSDVRYSRVSGEVLVSASFDGSAKVWSTRDWSLLRTLSGHEGKVTGCDVTPDEGKVVTCSFDRTVKVWDHQEFLATR